MDVGTFLLLCLVMPRLLLEADEWGLELELEPDDREWKNLEPAENFISLLALKQTCVG